LTVFFGGIHTSSPVECPYLPERQFVQNYFFASDVNETEMSILLASGWRRFGNYFFRANCPSCSLCIPVRVDAAELKPSKSQRRVLRRGAGIRMSAGKPVYSEELWKVYLSHQTGQFGKKPDKDDFINNLLNGNSPDILTEYRIGEELIGFGLLDSAHDGLSSVYFSFNPEWGRYSPGVLSVFRESLLTVSQGKRWYYLGYWVPGSRTMEYKAAFKPHQLYEWESGRWVDAEKHPFFEKINK